MSLDRLQVFNTDSRHVSFSLPNEQPDKFDPRTSIQLMASMDQQRFASKSSSKNIRTNKNSLERRIDKTKKENVSSSRNVSLPSLSENVSANTRRENFKTGTGREASRPNINPDTTKASTSRDLIKANTSPENNKASTSRERNKALSNLEINKASTSRDSVRSNPNRETVKAVINTTNREKVKRDNRENLPASDNRENTKSDHTSNAMSSKLNINAEHRGLENINVEDGDEEEYTSDSSYTSYDSPEERKPKKKWVLKLPWGKKIKQADVPSIESLYSSDSEASPKPETKDEERTSSSESSEEEVEKITKSIDALHNPSIINKKKKRAFSWYSTKSQSKLDSESSYSDVDLKKAVSNDNILSHNGKNQQKKEKKNQKRSKFNFSYSSSSEASIPKLTDKGGRKSKRTYHKEYSQSHSHLFDNASSILSDKESTDSLTFKRDTPSQQSEHSFLDEDEPQIKKSNSLPSIFFKRTKARNETSPIQKYVHKIEPCLNSFSDDESSMESTGIKADDERRNSSLRFKKDPKSKGKISSSKELNSNVESVSSIFKRVSYERVYPTQNFHSSIIYPIKQVDDAPSVSNKRNATKDSENIMVKDKHIQKRNSTESSSSLGKQSLKKKKNDVGKKKQHGTDIAVSNRGRSETVSELEIKNKHAKTTTSPMKRANNTQNLSIPTFSKRETAFDKTLQRDIRQAKITVNEVNNQFGPVIFSEVHKDDPKLMTKTISENHLFRPIQRDDRVEPESKKGIQAKSLSNLSTEQINSSLSINEMPMRRRGSYQEMLSILDDEMFDSDSDEIDLSFNKNTLETKIDFEVKSTKADPIMNHFPESDQELVYRVTITKKALEAQEPKHFKGEIRRPSYAPPAPPRIVIETIPDNLENAVPQDLPNYQQKETPIKTIAEDQRNSDSLTYSSSDIDDSFGYANVSENQSEKQNKREELKAEREREINRLIDISIQKYIIHETPPPFSPPISISKPKFSAGLNDYSRDQDIPTNNPSVENIPVNHGSNKVYPINDSVLYTNVPAKVVANHLFSKRDERSTSNYSHDNIHNLPIKNIKSLRLNDVLPSPPPDPPKFPPACPDPFSKNDLEENKYANVTASQKYSHTEPVIYNIQNKSQYNSDMHIPAIPVQLFRSESIDYNSLQQPSLQLLKAEIVEKTKSQPEVQLKREYLGPYGVSFLQDQDIIDSKKHAVTFYLPPEHDDDPIYANNEADFTILPPKLPPKPLNTDKIISPSKVNVVSLQREIPQMQDHHRNTEETLLLGSDISRRGPNSTNRSSDSVKPSQIIERHIAAIKEGTYSLSRASLTNYSRDDSSHNTEAIKKEDTTQPKTYNARNNESAGYYAKTVHTFPKTTYPLKSILRNSNRNIVPEKNSYISRVTSPKQSTQLVSTPVVTYSIDQLPELSPDINKPPALPKTPPPPPRLQKEEKQKFFGTLLKEEYKIQSDTDESEFNLSNSSTLPGRITSPYQSNLYNQQVKKLNPIQNRPHSAQGTYSYETKPPVIPQYHRPSSQQGYNFKEKIQNSQSSQTYSNTNFSGQKFYPNKPTISYKKRYPDPEAVYSNVQDDLHAATFQQSQVNQSRYDSQPYQNKHQSVLHQQQRQEPYKLTTERMRPTGQHSSTPYQYLHHTQVHPYSPQYLSSENQLHSQSLESLDSIASQNYSSEHQHSAQMINVPASSHFIHNEMDVTYQNMQRLKTDV